ncbi:hypothetical protein [Paraburkholderia fungorum]|uniref:hypothetical protein n=1 Tax=Paraburkholderia fungorum TaxID=134537 RepID=UPI0038BBB9C5
MQINHQAQMPALAVLVLALVRQMPLTIPKAHQQFVAQMLIAVLEQEQQQKRR